MLVSEETGPLQAMRQGVYRKCVGVSNPWYVAILSMLLVLTSNKR